MLVALSAMVFVPPWSMGMLPIAVAATEYSPVLALLDLAWLAVARVALRGRPAAQWTCTAALLIAAALASVPVTRFHAAAVRASAQLGHRDQTVRYSLFDSFRGPLVKGRVEERVIPYRAADGSALTMRLFRGEARGARPTVVVIYGGAWRSGTALQGANVSRSLTSRGYTVAAIDYRHAPGARFPAQLADVRASLALLRDSAASWSIDTTRIALLGRSAGGHLAELAAFAPGGPAVQAVVAIYAPFDLAEGYRDLPSPDPLDVRAALRGLLDATPDAEPARYRAASPASFIRAGLPPTLLLYGASDHVVKPDFNRQAAAALRAARVPVVQVELPWAEHGFDMAPGGIGAQLAYGVIGDFLDRRIGDRP